MNLTSPTVPTNEDDDDLNSNLNNNDDDETTDDINAGSSTELQPTKTTTTTTTANNTSTTTTTSKENIKPIKPMISSLKSDNNPRTINRNKKIKEGKPISVHFDERVIVHTVPLWDPCGTVYPDNGNDNDNGLTKPNCCIIL